MAAQDSAYIRPSSSGKTTTQTPGVQLMTNLLKPRMISLDDYFVDRDRTPRDHTGDYDYESLYALDLAQFNADLTAILAGEEVELPTYNFERRSANTAANAYASTTTRYSLSKASTASTPS